MNIVKALGVSGLAVGTFLVASMWNQSRALADEAPQARPRLDLAFCIDTTGSMAAEIEVVKKKTKELVAKLASGKPAPIVRVGLVAFRDRGDDYVTRTYQFSDNIDKVVKDISELEANGGGDTPEAVNQALHVAINDLEWSKDKKTSKLLFLIGDAEPHIYPGDFTWEDESKSAISHGIQINTIGCDGLDANGTSIFEQIAKRSDGKFETLAYRQEVVNSTGEREVFITSGGARYKVDKTAAAEWKMGAADLAAKGMARRVSEPMPTSSAVAGVMRPRAHFGRALMGAPAGGGGAAGFHAAPASGGDEFASSAEASSKAVDRKESNLDDLMLNAAKAKMKKDSAVEYKK